MAIRPNKHRGKAMQINRIELNIPTGTTEELPLIVNGVHVADITATTFVQDGLPNVRLMVTGYIVAEDDNALNTCQIDSQTFQREGWIVK